MWGFILFVLALVGQVAIVAGLAWVFFPPVVQEWDEAENRGLTVVKILRTVVSVIAAIYFAISYGTQISSYERGMALTIVKYVGGSVMMMLFVPIILVVMLIFARRLHLDRRQLVKSSVGRVDGEVVTDLQRLAKRLRLRRRVDSGPRNDHVVGSGVHLGMISASLAFLFGVIGFLLLTVYLFDTMEAWLYRQWPPVQLIVGLLCLVWLTVAVLAVAAAGLAAMETGFNAAVTHPYIPPLLGLVFLVSLAFGDQIWVLIPAFDDALNPSSTYVNMGPYKNPAQWAALIWAVLIAGIEIVVARRALRGEASSGPSGSGPNPG